MAVSTPARPDRRHEQRVDGEKAVIRLYDDWAEYACRIDVERDDRWAFGVDSDGIAGLLTNSTGAETVPQ